MSCCWGFEGGWVEEGPAGGEGARGMGMQG